MPVIENKMFRASGACSGAETRRSMHIQNYVGTPFPQKISEFFLKNVIVIYLQIVIFCKTGSF